MNPTKILWQDLKPSAEKLSFYTAVQKRVRVLSQFSKTEICLSFFQPEVKLVNFWLPPKVKEKIAFKVFISIPLKDAASS